MIQRFSHEDVTMRDVPDIGVAFMSHHGDPQRLGETIRRFIAWRKGHGVRAADHATYTIFHTDPGISGPDAYHLDLASEIRRSLTSADEGVEAGVIPGALRCPRHRQQRRFAPGCGISLRCMAARQRGGTP
jgi:AraC family transcriptional regulator